MSGIQIVSFTDQNTGALVEMELLVFHQYPHGTQLSMVRTVRINPVVEDDHLLLEEPSENPDVPQE